ncbi:MAG: glucokinase [Methylocapsa sp.]|nr:glucokinase [Methylocapsa sp.]
MMEFPFPVLLCDVGGTNARFSLLRAPHGTPEHGPGVKTRQFTAFEHALAAALPAIRAKPRSLILCAAGPVIGRAIKLTNASWIIEGTKIAAEIGLDQGLLLNDFEAQAFSLPFIKPAWTVPIGEPAPALPGSRLIMGLGTGLGVAALANAAGKYIAIPSEAGHMDFGPLQPEEWALWPYFDKAPFGRLCAEAILSGQGLMRLHLARSAVSGIAASVTDEVALIAAAKQNPRSTEAETLRLCWRLAGRFAGDLALAFVAKGGVTFGGGILPRMAEFCDPKEFRAAFENKAPYEELLAGIGTRLIVAENTVFAGMAAIASAPQDFAIDYASRAWR